MSANLFLFSSLAVSIVLIRRPPDSCRLREQQFFNSSVRFALVCLLPSSSVSPKIETQHSVCSMK
ncbi:unnamed protein product, partial [Nesidiocoris tenuis]